MKDMFDHDVMPFIKRYLKSIFTSGIYEYFSWRSYGEIL